MERKMLTRYLILLMALMIFAGAAWYFTKDSGTPQAGAVLAELETPLTVFRDSAYSEQADAAFTGSRAGLPTGEEAPYGR